MHIFKYLSLLTPVSSTALYTHHQNQGQHPINMDPKTTPKPTVYFGYGSNLWLHQMQIRCPSSQYLGIARLSGYKWIINDRGYANVVEITNTTTSSSDSQTQTQSKNKGKKENYQNEVYGLVYTLFSSDESRLDQNEGVPIAYTKENLPCTFWATPEPPSSPESPHGTIDVSKPPTAEMDMLVYIDRKRVEPATPRDEYVYRMNRGIDDALKVGVPKGYVEQVMRRFIEGDGGKEAERKRMEEVAEAQAGRFRDESGVF